MLFSDEISEEKILYDINLEICKLSRFCWNRFSIVVDNNDFGRDFISDDLEQVLLLFEFSKFEDTNRIFWNIETFLLYISYNDLGILMLLQKQGLDPLEFFDTGLKLD